MKKNRIIPCSFLWVIAEVIFVVELHDTIQMKLQRQNLYAKASPQCEVGNHWAALSITSYNNTKKESQYSIPLQTKYPPSYL